MKKFLFHFIFTLVLMTSFIAVHAQEVIDGVKFERDPLCGNITTECCDGRDNQVGDGQDYGYGAGKGDGKADFYGLIGVKDGKTIIYPADPSCIKPDTAVESADLPIAGTLIPCTNKCSFPDIIKIINNVLNFLITTVFLPIFILVFIYAGYQYLTARGNASKITSVKKMLMSVVIGLVIVLTAWLVVKVLFQTIGVDQGLLFID